MKAIYRIFTASLMAASLGIGTLAALPAQAQPRAPQGHGSDRGYHNPSRTPARSDDRRPDRNRPAARHGPQRPNSYSRGPDRRPAIVHPYDYNRPDPRFGGYYANNYYRSGYAPIRVTRQTRIYRGRDDRWYCRRSDGTTGLIVGAALGGILGNSIDRGQSSILGVLLGASAGALLGREIDRGAVSCR